MDPFGRDAADEPPVVDINALHRREWRRLERERRRKVFRQRLFGGLAGLAILTVGVYAAFAWVGNGSSDATPDQSAVVDDAPAPVRVELDPVPDVPVVSAAAGSDLPSVGELPHAGSSGASDDGADAATPARLSGESGSLADQERAAERQGAITSAASGKRPIVWIQAGHVSPREPGYSAQTGASSGPFGSEQAFNTRVSNSLIAKLKRSGVDARYTPGLVTPIRNRGAAFVSIHSDTPEGRAAIGHAITGANENYYHGEGTGTASPVPYPDSAPHRPATTVSSLVQRRSLDLANRVSTRYRTIYTSANGARASYGGVQTPSGNPRMMRYYGYYRTTAEARIIVECGAGTTDDAFLARTDLISTTIARGITDHLRSRGLLRR